MSTREADFFNIYSELKCSGYSVSNIQESLVVNGDSLEILKKIPDHTISLILTDPPYHVTKKKNIHGDTSFKDDASYLEWLSQLSKEWLRILKPNGSLYIFCDSSMSAKIEVLLEEKYNILSHIVWTKPNLPGFDGWKGKMNKEALRQWYGHSERIIFAEPAYGDNLFRSYFGCLLKELRKESGLSGNKLTEIVGAYGKVNHGGAVSNWEAGRNTPSREQYEKIRQALLQTGNVENVPDFEDTIRAFYVNADIEYTDTWNFPSVKQYKGKHPAEKPIEMLEHIIKASSYKDDIVLDCFSGSGNTAIAALNLNRKTIAIDIEEKWTSSLINKLNIHFGDSFELQSN